MQTLIARNLVKKFGPHAAVDGASLVLERGSITCLLGPSGSGKSTLLRMIAGLERPDSGEILIDGALIFGPGCNVAPEKRGVGLVFQDFALFPHLDVRANIGFGLNRWTGTDRKDRVEELLHRFRLGPRAHAFPAQLSGGEQQRVAIARALAPRPPVLLMDEPFAGLDGELRRTVQMKMAHWLREEGAAVLIVTHDAVDAMRTADVLCLMDSGKVLQTGTPAHCYEQPSSLAAALLLGPVNAVPAAVLGLEQGGIALVRPESIILGKGDIAAKVLSAAFVGGSWEVHCQVDGCAHSLLCLAPRQPDIGPVMLRIASHWLPDQPDGAASPA